MKISCTNKFIFHWNLVRSIYLGAT